MLRGHTTNIDSINVAKAVAVFVLVFFPDQWNLQKRFSRPCQKCHPFPQENLPKKPLINVKEFQGPRFWTLRDLEGRGKNMSYFVNNQIA